MKSDKDMLSFEEWTRLHSARLRGVSQPTKKARYDQYVRTYRSRMSGSQGDAITHPSKGGRKARHKKRIQKRLSETDVERAVRKRLEVDDFYKALINPFTNEPARVPRMTGEHTGVWQSKFNVPVFSDDQGQACFYMVPRIQACYAVSKEFSDVTSTYNPALYLESGSMVYNAIGNPSFAPQGRTSGVGTWTGNSYAVSGCINTSGFTGTPIDVYTGLADIPRADEVIGLFTDYVVTAAGMNFTYTGPPLTGSGAVVVAPQKGAYGVPYMYNGFYSSRAVKGEVESYGRVVNDSGSSEAQIGLTFDTIEEFEDATVIGAMEGFTHTWRPSSVEYLQDWNPNRLSPNGNPVGAYQVSDAGATGTVHFPPSCGTNPDEFKAFYDEMNSVNKLVNQGGNGGGIGLYFNNIVNTSAPTGPDLENLRKQCQARSTLFNNQSMHECSEAMVAFWTGVPPNIQIGTMEVVINFEGLVDSRAISLGKPSPLIGKLPAVPIAAAQHAQPTVSDIAVEGNHEKMEELKLDQAVPKIHEQVMSAVETASDIGDTIADVAAGALDVISVLGAIF